MDRQQFHGALRVLLNIDQRDAIAAGIPSMRNPEVWRNFRDDPFRWFIHCDDETAPATDSKWRTR
jgi:hypothetical protein